MRKYYLQAIGLILMLLTSGALFGQQIEFDIRYVPASGEYEVYARPDSSNPNFFVGGGSQLSIVFPASVGDTGIPITSVNGGLWFDNSKIYAPASDEAHDFHAIASNGGMTNMVAGEEMLLFKFTIPEICADGVRLFENDTDPQSSDPGMAGGDFRNYYANVLTLQDAYWQNYNNDADSCDSDGDGLTDGEELTGIDDPSTPNVPTDTSMPNDICDPYFPTVDAVATYNLNPDCSPSDLTLNATITQALGAITSLEWNGPNGFSSTDEDPMIPNVTSDYNGDYTLAITDANGCTAEQVVSVQGILNTVPAPQISGLGSFCEGEDFVLSIDEYQGSSVTYTWSTPSGATNIAGLGTNEITIQNLSNTSQGDYTVTVEVDGCTLNSDVYDLNMLAAPTVNLVTTSGVICTGEDLSLLANTSSGALTTYSWTGPNGFSSILQNPVLSNVSNLNNGQYVVTVTNNLGCSTVQNTFVNTIAAPPATPNILSQADLCDGEELVLSTSIAGATFEWIGPLGDSPSTLAISGLTTSTGSTSLDESHPSYLPGEWKVRVTDLNGCTAESAAMNISINEMPIAFAENDGPICEAEPVKLIAAEIIGGTYEWYDGDPVASPPPNLISMEKEPIMTNLSAGTHDFYLKVKKDNCTSEVASKTTVQVNAIPEISFISQNATYCEGTDVILTGNNNNILTGDITYNWTGPNNFNFTGTVGSNDPFDITIPNIGTDMNGIYQLELSTPSNCFSTTESVLINVDVSPTTPLLDAQSDILCEGETIELNVPLYSGSSVSYEWFFNDGVTNTSIGTTNSPTLLIPNTTIDDSGDYSILVTVNGCPSQVSNTLDIIVQGVTSSPEANNTTSTTEPACEGETIQLSVPFFVGASYEWFGPNSFTSNLPNPVITAATVNDAGQYYAVLNLPNNCATVVSTTTTVNVQTMPTAPTITNSGSVCEGGDVLLSVSSPLIVPPGVDLTFEWFFATTNTLVGTTSDPELQLTNLTTSQAGQYYMILTVGNCVAPQTTFTNIEVDDISQNEAYAGDDFEICVGSTATLGATAPTVGVGNWASTTGATIVSSELPNTAVTDLILGENIFIWTLSNGVCENYDSDTIIVTVTEQSSETANAGLNLDLCNTDNVSLNATPSSVANGTWTQSATQAGQGVTIVDPNDPNTAITGLQIGNTYVFNWSLSQGNCSAFSSDDVTVSISDIPVDLPFIAMQDVIYLCESEDLTLEAVAPTTATGLWTTNSSALIVNASSSSTIVADLSLGENVFVWSLSNGVCGNYASDSITVFVEENLIANPETYDIVFNDSLTNENILANDYISNVADWDISISQPPSNGTLQISDDGIIDYTPNTNYFGSDTLIYRLCNVNCPTDCDTALVIFNITGVNASGECFIPNVITPDGDGVNDYFMVPCIDTFDDSNIKIFNRWGDEVFNASPYENNWGGTHNGKELPAGTYFYILDYKANGKAQSIQGYITLFR